jgi:hypothetical protein
MIIFLEIEVEHVSGKFAGKSDIADVLIGEIENMGTLDVDGTEYEVVSASESDEPAKAPKAKP